MKTKLKILHLEDTPTDAELVERELKKANIQFKTLVVGNKTDFIKALDEFAPDIVLSDHTLPSFNSLEAIKLIKQHGINIPFILVTATVSDEYAVEIIKAGADDYILKDRLHRLPQAVLNAIDKNRSEVNLQTIFENTSEGFILVDKQGIVKIFNAKFAENNLLNTGKHIKIGSDIYDFIHPSRKENYKNVQSKVLAGETVHYENLYERKNGDTKWFSATINPAYNKSGEIEGACITSSDITARKITEHNLFQSEIAIGSQRDQFYDMFLKAPSAIGMLKGPDHVFEMANPLYLKLTGKKNIVGKTVAEVLPEVVDQGFVKILDHVYQTGESHTGTEMLVKVDTESNGEMTDFYIDFVYQAYRNNKGDIEGIFFFINDITEQIRSREEIKKSEKFFKGVIESSADMITLTDAAGKTIYASPAATKNFGYSYEECLETNIAEIVHPEDALKMKDFFEKILLHPGVPMEVPLIRDRKKDGSYMWVEGTATNFLETEGINAVVSNFKDITEKKKDDEEIRFKANLLNTIGQSAIATDLNGIVNYWNRAAEDIYGWSQEEALGKNIIDLTTSEATIEQSLQIMEDLKKGQTWSGEFKVQKKDGSLFTALITNSPIYDEHEIISGMIGISSDITELKKLEDLLEKTNRLAAVGSWEIDVIKGTVFWSDITKEIREVDKDYVPILGEGISYFKGKHREIINQKVKACIDHGTPWDEELQIITFKGNIKWIRTIGGGEFLNGKCIRIHGSFQDIDNLKNAEIKTRESELRYRQIVETAQEGIWMLDENNTTSFVNQKMCEIMGYSFDEMIGKSNLFFKAKADLQPALDALKRRKKGIVETYDASFLTKDGRHIWTQISSNPIFDDNQKFLGALGMVSDITDKLMADKMLLESEQKFRNLASELEIERTRLVAAQSVAKVGSWETDLQTFQVKWSEEMYRLYGTNPNDFTPSYSCIQSFVHPDDKKMIDKAFMGSLNNNEACSIEHRIVTLDGIEKWVEESWTITRDEKEFPLVAFGTCQDITESKKAADKVLKSETKLKVAQRIARVGSWEVDLSTNEHSWSDEFYRILRIDENITPSIEALLPFIHPDDRAMAVSTMEDAFSIHSDASFQFRFAKKNGETGYASSKWKFEFDKHHHPLYIHGILKDLTTEKKAECERVKMISDIVQRNSDLEQFSYIVSHNLRAPAANIIGFAEILQDKTITPQEQIELLQGLSASVTGLDNIIKDINIILQSKRDVHEKKEDIIFSKLVNDIMLSIGNLIDKHRVLIITDFAEVDTIYSLKVYLYSIFYNLISNSIKYSKPNVQPRIEIRSKQENGKIILIFKDNGLGMDLETKGDRIFGLYNRFHTHVEGKGMGLFMVKTQVEALGGEISVASELDKGTEFTMVFEI